MITDTQDRTADLDARRAMLAAHDAHKAAHGALLEALYRWQWERNHDALAAALEEDRRTLHAAVNASAKYYGTPEAP